MIKATLSQLAELVQGTVVGDPELAISGAATLQDAQPHEISFVDHPKLGPHLEKSAAAAVIVPCDYDIGDRAGIRVDAVRQAFAAIVAHFRPPFELTDCGISPLAVVDPSAQLADGVQVHPGAVIGPDVELGRNTIIHANVTLMGRCRIGEDVVIFPGCVLYRDTEVGDRTVIHANAVIGAYGFGYDTIQGRHLRGDQLGYVQIEADVEIGASTTIDRGTYGATIIGEGSKIDNQVMIAHNCRIGRHNLICSQVGVAGSSSSGDYVVMAGQVGVPDHVRIGHRAILGAKAGIMRDVPDDTTVIGIPATPERDQMAKQAAFAKLPEMRRQLRKLARQIEALTSQVDSRSDSEQQPEAA